MSRHFNVSEELQLQVQGDLDCDTACVTWQHLWPCYEVKMTAVYKNLSMPWYLFKNKVVLLISQTADLRIDLDGIKVMISTLPSPVSVQPIDPPTLLRVEEGVIQIPV